MYTTSVFMIATDHTFRRESEHHKANIRSPYDTDDAPNPHIWSKILHERQGGVCQGASSRKRNPPRMKDHDRIALAINVGSFFRIEYPRLLDWSCDIDYYSKYGN